MENRVYKDTYDNESEHWWFRVRRELIQYLLKKLAKDHWLAIVLAFLVGLIYLAPNVFFIYQLGNKFSGVEFTSLDAEEHELVILNEIKSGYTNYSSPLLYEYKNQSEPLLSYTEVFYGLIIRYLHIPLPVFYLASKFIFPMIIFLLWYWLSFLIAGNKRGALLSSLLLVFGYSLLENPSLLKQLSIIFWNTSDVSLILYGRFVNPLLTFPLFFAGLIAIYNLFRKNNLKIALLCGVILGVNFYMYFYFWAYLLALLGVLFLYNLFKKDFLASRNIFYSTIIAFLVGWGFVLPMIKASFFGGYELSSSRVYAPYTLNHHFIFPTLVLFTVSIFAIYLFFKSSKEKNVTLGDKFTFLLLIASFVAVNQQVITGRLVEQGHFHWYTNVPIIFLSATLVFSYFIEKIRNNFIKSTIYFIASIYIISFGIGVQASGYKKYFQKYEYYQNYGIVFNWLNKNSAKESVILGNDDFSDLLPAYTYNNAYYAPHAVYYSTTPLERRLWAVDVYYYLNYRDKKDIDQEFKNRKVELGTFALPLVNYRNDCGSYDCYPDEFLQEMIESYKIFMKNSFEENLKKYRIDYVVWDRNKNLDWRLDEFKFLNLIYSTNNINIYTLK
jgi:hypothetical protein